MVKFLGTENLKVEIKELIESSTHELVIVVPYIKISSQMYSALRKSHDDGVEITIIYREEKMVEKEKNRILKLSNLNLFHHPNIHCKFYFNGDRLIVCSLNLYEYSEKNNREMGILITRGYSRGFNLGYYSDTLFQDAIKEVREILTGAEHEKICRKRKKSKFSIKILRTEAEQIQDIVEQINQFFLNKSFASEKNEDEEWILVCKNYFDKVDVVFQGYNYSDRIAIEIKVYDQKLKNVYNKWMDSYDEFEFRGFKYYWNGYNKPIYLYRDYNYQWDEIVDTDLEYRKFKQGIDLIISKYREILKKIN